MRPIHHLFILWFVSIPEKWGILLKLRRLKMLIKQDRVSIPEKWGILLKRISVMLSVYKWFPVSIPEKWGILLKQII